MQPEAVARLEHRNVQDAIIGRIGEDLRPTARPMKAGSTCR